MRNATIEKSKAPETYILGIPGLESNLIIDLLEKKEKEYVFITGADGLPATPRTVYRGNTPSVPNPVFVGCADSSVSAVAHIDSYNSSDVNVEKDPTIYWRSTNVGKVYRRLGARPTLDTKMGAASGYCLRLAYRGLCRGINKEKFIDYRAKYLANRDNLSISAIKGKLKIAYEELSSLTPILIDKNKGDGVVIDVRKYNIDYKIEAAAMLDLPILYTEKLDRFDTAEIFNGGLPSEVRAWLTYRKHDLVHIYPNEHTGIVVGYPVRRLVAS